MLWLVDANILLRVIHRPDPLQPLVWGAIVALRGRGEILCYSLQSLTEFWAVCTRPLSARGGFGLTVGETDRRVRLLERRFTFLSDSLAVRNHWRGLVVAR